MPMPVKTWGAYIKPADDELWFTEAADKEPATAAAFAPWGAFQPRLEESEADIRASVGYWLRHHPEVDPEAVVYAQTGLTFTRT